MWNRNRVIVRTVALAAGALLPCVIAGMPASAAQALPFNAAVGGTLQVTGVGPNGPTSAFYSGRGVATQIGAVQMQGNISIQGPADCPNGFVATHDDVLTASTGDQVWMTITEKSCPRPSDPSTYDCTGTYTMTGGTGRFATVGGNGTWAGSVHFTSQASADFNTSYSGVISGIS